MLKGIPAILSPDLLKILMEMGHGDEIVLADGNFPAASHAQRLIRCDGHGIEELLQAIAPLLPLDRYVKHPVGLMQVVAGDPSPPEIWQVYAAVLRTHAPEIKEPFEPIERFAFYERAKDAYAIVATGESALYANLILKKGVISA